MPAKLNEAKALLQKPEENVDWQTLADNYKCISRQVTMNSLAQRWVLIFSEQAHKREQETLHRKINKGYELLKKSLWHLSNQEFSCDADAKKAVLTLIKRQKYHDVDYKLLPIKQYEKKGRPSQE